MVRSFIISIHALLAESDARQCYTDTTSVGFLSTLSLRRATAIGRWGTAWRDISIHALLAESDHRARDYTSPQTCISIHALLAESDQHRRRSRRQVHLFLSTLSLRRATGRKCQDLSLDSHFYPRSPCGERPSCCHCFPGQCGYFYPRSPCGERRPEFSDTAQHTYFYPRSPCGERLARSGCCLSIA